MQRIVPPGSSKHFSREKIKTKQTKKLTLKQQDKKVNTTVDIPKKLPVFCQHPAPGRMADQYYLPALQVVEGVLLFHLEAQP